jgi:hypothetical protein
MEIYYYQIVNIPIIFFYSIKMYYICKIKNLNNIILAILKDTSENFFEHFPTSRYINSILKRNILTNTTFNGYLLLSWRCLLDKNRSKRSYSTHYFVRLENKMIDNYLSAL